MSKFENLQNLITVEMKPMYVDFHEEQRTLETQLEATQRERSDAFRDAMEAMRRVADLEAKEKKLQFRLSELYAASVPGPDGEVHVGDEYTPASAVDSEALANWSAADAIAACLAKGRDRSWTVDEIENALRVMGFSLSKSAVSTALHREVARDPATRRISKVSRGRYRQG